MQRKDGGPEWREEASAEALAGRLAKDVAGLLRRAIEERGRALLAVSGGTTPLRFFDALSKEDLAWEKVTVILADERFVPTESSRSNARLVTLNLLHNNAAKAHFEGLYTEAETVEDAARIADQRMRSLPFPPDIVVLGMGTDGHVASLFPDWDRLSLALDPHRKDHVLAVRAPSAIEQRLTLTLARLAAAPFLALLIEGNEKKAVLTEILARNRDENAPVLAVIKNAKSPVKIYWTPLGTN
jgi:6-phosphogluconolactonase